jgi:phenylalanyl-tRNA synthetase beta chain
MKLNIAWVRELVATRTSAASLADRLIHTSSELEDTINWPERLHSVVVGKVVSIEQHPNASRLRVAQVDTGLKRHTIVCGGVNLAEGQHVALALPGAVLKPLQGESFTIQTTTIRGVESVGMICAQEELGFPAGNPGEIWVLPVTSEPGTSLSTYLGLTDEVLDLEITPNRPDLLSHVGLAREIAAFERKPLREPIMMSIDPNARKLPQLTEITIVNKDVAAKAACLSFILLPGAKTPAVALGRLYAAGIRSVHPIVDATNYVMLELGQPLHAYDRHLLTKNGEEVALRVEALASSTNFEALDGKTYALEAGDTVITTGNEVVSLGGIIGGAATAVHENTTEVTVESVCFSAPPIRRASRRLGVRSEASLRSEKRTDQELVVPALKRLAELLSLWKIAEPSSKLSDTKSHRTERSHITVTVQDISQHLGMNMSIPDAKHILQSLGFRTVSTTKSSLACIPPSWRADVTCLEDCIEEIARMWGYDRIPMIPMQSSARAPRPNQTWKLKQRLSVALAAAGYSETQLLPFVSGNAIQRAGFSLDNAVRLDNPFNAHTEYLAQSGVITQLSALAADTQSAEHFQFEIAARFTRLGDTYTEEETLVVTAHSDIDSMLLYDELRHAIELACAHAEIASAILWKPSDTADCATLVDEKSGVEVGSCRLFDSTALGQWKIRRGKRALIAELSIRALLSLGLAPLQYRDKPQYPTVSRDISLSTQVKWADVMEKLIESAPSLLLGQPEVVSKAMVSAVETITVRCTYGAERTLTDEEAQGAHDSVLKALANIAGVTIR